MIARWRWNPFWECWPF